ncbi:ATP-binding protein [Psychromonas sp. MME2]|uniref:ATP-binding protein n=1 Tax=Psychromonas sp. MME2 TaxID=3231033 RepID=UPI00339BC9DD
MKNNNSQLISIKKRLIVSSISITTLLVLISWAFIVQQSKDEVTEVYDARLGESAKVLALAIPNILAMPAEQGENLYAYWFKGIQNVVDHKAPKTNFGHIYEENLIFQFYQDNKVVFKSPTAPDEALTDLDNMGFNHFTFHEQIWRSFLLKIPNDKHQLYMLVAEKQSIRNEAIMEIALSTSLPQLLLIVILSLTTLLLVNKFLQPITQLQEAVSLRNINNLEPIMMQHSSVELTPLVEQLNYLLEQLSKAWEREKRFTRTAAHELKTPLAILRLNAENALNSNNISEQRSDLNNIISGINRTDRLIQQLLMYSRIESQQNLQSTPINVTSILRDVIAHLAPVALKRQQNISLLPIEHCTVYGNATLLSILFTNLIDNAIRYSGDKSDITIKMHTDATIANGKSLQILIMDNGKQIADVIRDKIFEKFFRGDSGKGDGAGLGMSIADDIVKRHQGSFKLQPYNATDGNVFEILLPLLESEQKM